MWEKPRHTAEHITHAQCNGNVSVLTGNDKTLSGEPVFSGKKRPEERCFGHLVFWSSPKAFGLDTGLSYAVLDPEVFLVNAFEASHRNPPSEDRISGCSSAELS